MKAKIAILLPTYKRPGELKRIADNVKANTKNSYTLYFGLEKDDERSYDVAKTLGVAYYNQYEPGYSNTIQTLYENSTEPFIIHANDDFEFHKDWDVTPLAMFDTPTVMVVGLKQTEGDNHGSAISMFRREYIADRSGVVDMPNRVFYPYNHNYVDTEFTETAQSRGVWAKCEPRVITHMHPGFSGRERDETDNKNMATVEIDKETFLLRRHLWQ